MLRILPDLTLRLATSEADRMAAYRLRYDVFVREGRATGPGIDHTRRTEIDHWDAWAEHLLLIDARGPDERVVGTYRFLTEEAARAAGGFYTETEFDLTRLARSGRRLLELGRSCLHPDYRGGVALHLLWDWLADYAAAERIGIVFGAASFPGTDLGVSGSSIALLMRDYPVAADLRPVSRAMPSPPVSALEPTGRRAAALAIPPLIKSYIKRGARVGDGCFVDTSFGCIDVCLVLEVDQLTASRDRRAPRGAEG
jgi:putative hemolysin